MAKFRSAANVLPGQHNQDRIRRAESWWRRSVETSSDTDKFIFLWIAFNAAYGVEAPLADPAMRIGESEKFRAFCEEVVRRDDHNILHDLLLNTYSGPVRVLLNNHFVYEPFWKWVSGIPQAAFWETQFRKENNRAFGAVMRGETSVVLKVVLSRLYTLRNQIFHGGATYATGWGQDQVRDGSSIMASIVPAIIAVMRADIERNPDSDVWGKVAYPRVGDERS